MVVASISACWLLPFGRVFQSSLKTIAFPFSSCSSSVGLANAPVTGMDGPRGRRHFHMAAAFCPRRSIADLLQDRKTALPALSNTCAQGEGRMTR